MIRISVAMERRNETREAKKTEKKNNVYIAKYRDGQMLSELGLKRKSVTKARLNNNVDNGRLTSWYCTFTRALYGSIFSLRSNAKCRAPAHQCVRFQATQLLWSCHRIEVKTNSQQYFIEIMLWFCFVCEIWVGRKSWHFQDENNSAKKFYTRFVCVFFSFFF